MSNFNNLRIQEAANYLGVSSKTLRRWEANGKLIPSIRTKGNQRLYTVSQLDAFKLFKDEIPAGEKLTTEPIYSQNINAKDITITPAVPWPVSKYLKYAFAISIITGILLTGLTKHLPGNKGSTFSGTFDKVEPYQDLISSGLDSRVLAESTEVEPFSFQVAVPAIFKETVTMEKPLVSPNMLSEDSAGEGIDISFNTDGLPIIDNTMPSFSSIAVSGQTSLTPSSSDSILTFASGTGISVTTISSDNKVTISASSSDLNVSGWTDGGTDVYLKTITDEVGIGTSSPAYNLHVVGTAYVSGAATFASATFSSTVDITGALNLTGNSLTSTGDLTIDPTGGGVKIGTGTPASVDLAGDDLYITGDMEVAGTIYGNLSSAGGTINPGFTTGSVVFQGASGLAQDNSNFFYDDTNNRLGIGTTSPQKGLDLNSTLYIRGNTTIGNGLVIAPDTDLGADLGTTNYRFNNLWVANINSNSSQAFSGQTTFSYAPTDDTITKASVIVNPTTAAANGQLTAWAIAGYERAAIDEDGDLTLGYSDATSIPASDYPLSIYNHGATRIAYFDTDGNLNIGGSIISGSGITATGDFTIAAGYSIIPSADQVNALSIGNASSVDYVSFDTISSRVGIGTTAPQSSLDVAGTVNLRGAAGVTGLYVDTAGLIGIGTTVPSTKLHIVGTTEQLRLGYDTSNYTSFTVDSSGNLTLADTGTNIATLGASAAEFFVPTAFSATGDVSIAYDIVLTNQTSGGIYSYGPMIIESGESFENNNLTLKTYGTGDLFADIGGNFLLQSADPAIVFDTLTATDTDFWMGVTEDAGGDDDDYFSIGKGIGIGTSAYFNINTSGYIGIGTTGPITPLEIPGSTTNSSAKFGTFELQSYAVNNAWLSDNVYYNGGFKYRSNGYGAIQYFEAGGFEVRTAPSGTAGNAATMTQRFIVQQNGTIGLGGNMTSGSLTGANMLINSSGNVGIGTTSPGTKLGVVGGMGIGTTDSFANAAVAANNVAIQGNVGIGVTNPLQKLHVEGQCVAAGTLIKRRKKKKGQFTDEWEDVPVEDIAPGDEVSTFNETDGEFVIQKVEKVLDKDIQQAYEIQTITGKRIKTTANHPYFNINRPEIVYGTFEVDQSIRIEDLSRPTIIGIALEKIMFTAKISPAVKKEILKGYQKQNKPAVFSYETFAQAVAETFRAAQIYPSRIVIDIEYPGYDTQITRTIKRSFPESEVIFKAIGKHSKAHFAAYGATTGKRLINTTLKAIKNGRGLLQALRAVTPQDKSLKIRSPHGQLRASYYKEADLSRSKWVKTSQIKIGSYIATEDGFEKVVNLFPAGRLQMYDLQIAKTHNFVANGVVAHNTYISSNLGIGTTSPSKALGIVGGVGIGTTDSFANAAIAANNAALQGDLGIGTTSPTMDLDIVNGAAYSRINAGDADFTASSSRDVKENLLAIDNTGILQKISAIPVYTFDYINGPKDKMGLIAEDFYAIFGRGSDKEINYQEVTMALWLGMQELNKQMEQLGISQGLPLQENPVQGETLNNLTVAGQTTLGDTTITGALTAGLIQIDGLNNSLNATGVLNLQSLVLGNIEFLDKKIVMDTQGNLEIKEGVVLGNDNFRSAETLAGGETTVRVDRDWDSPPVSITVTPTYNTTVWVENISETGFTIKVVTAPTTEAKINWLAIW